MAKNKPNLPQNKQTQPQPAVRPAVKTKTTSNDGSWLSGTNDSNPLFTQLNFILLGLGALLIIIGFILMSGGNTDPKIFNKDEIYSFRRITLAPITVIAGFLVIIVAILKKPATPSDTVETTPTI